MRKRLARLLAWAFVFVCANVMVLGSAGYVAQADHITGTGINCWAAVIHEDEYIGPNETFVWSFKCFAAAPMDTALATMIAAECSAPFVVTINHLRGGTTTNYSTTTNKDWCITGGATTSWRSLGVGVSHGELQTSGSTIAGNDAAYPANSFQVSISAQAPSNFTCAPGSTTNCIDYITRIALVDASTYTASWSPYPSPNNRLYGPTSVIGGTCEGDPECNEYTEGFPHPFVGGEDWPDPLCESYGVTWDPADHTTLGVGERQRVTLTAPHAQWDDVTLLYSWSWGYDPINGWDVTTEPAVYSVPIVEERTATTITLASAPVGSAKSNEQFHIRCDPDDVVQDNTYYRRAYGDLSTSDGPSRRACYFLRFELDGPASDTWDTLRTGRAWVEEDSRYDAAGGITALAYGWRPTDGVRITEAFTYTGTGPPWATSPAEVDFEVDSSGFTGPTSGHQQIKCTDSSGDIWLTPVLSIPTNPGDTGGSGDGSTVGGTGGVGGENLGDVTPGGGDPGPGEGGIGVGPGGVGTGSGTGASCFNDAGWSLLNPFSWVTGGIKVGGCYLRALVVPSPQAVEEFVDDVSTAAEGTFPLSLFTTAHDALEAFSDSASAAGGSCQTMGGPIAGVTIECVSIPEMLSPSQKSLLTSVFVGALILGVVWQGLSLVLNR